MGCLLAGAPGGLFDPPSFPTMRLSVATEMFFEVNPVFKSIPYVVQHSNTVTPYAVPKLQVLEFPVYK